MKTLELKLKKDVLIVEIPRLADYEFINKECKYLKVGNEEVKLNASTLDKFEFLCKGSELTEEVLINFIDVKRISSSEGEIFPDFKNKGWLFGKPNRYRSFISAVESKGFYWLENPFKDWKSDGEIHDDDLDLVYKEAEEKTFKNPLIFVKK